VYSQPVSTTVRSPSLLLALLEAPRAITEASSLLPVCSLLKNLPDGDGHTVMALPGFLASDRSTRVLRRYIAEWGYDARRGGQGRNLGLSRQMDIERLLDERLRNLVDCSGDKVSLVGWSLGGLFAIEMARRNPQYVRSVIALGSPIGNPRATNAWWLHQALSGIDIDDDAIRKRVSTLRDPLPDVPVTAIYSNSDAIVSADIARLPPGDNVENIGVRTSHLGMGFNPVVLFAIADRLRQPLDNWSPFDISRARRLFYHQAT
jgi:pimeloyl-ACP methyl ester carboxylesterase